MNPRWVFGLFYKNEMEFHQIHVLYTIIQQTFYTTSVPLKILTMNLKFMRA
jgi:hypothetical protein